MAMMMTTSRSKQKKEQVESQKAQTASLAKSWSDGYAQGCCEAAAWALLNPLKVEKEFRGRFGDKFDVELKKRAPKEEGSIFDE